MRPRPYTDGAPTLRPMHSVTLTHTHETAHRLPHLGGQCTSLHGHSWNVEITVSARYLTLDHTVVEFGDFKKRMRAWIDTHLDHGTMLGASDPLVTPLRLAGCKIWRFGADYLGASWPTVEAVARMIGERSALWLADMTDLAADARVTAVTVRETGRNLARWDVPGFPDVPTLAALFPGDSTTHYLAKRAG